MPASFGNIHSKVPLRAAYVLSAATLSVIALAGTVAYPARGLEEARDEQALASARAAEARSQRELHARFVLAQGAERIARAEERLDGLFPRDLSPIELRGTLCVLARAAGLELDVLSVSSAVPTELEVFEDRLAVREMAFTGRGSLSALVDLVEALRGLGYPTSIVEFDVSRPGARTTEFEVRATLGLFESIPPPDEVALQPGEAQQGA